MKRPSDMLPEELTGTSDYEKLIFDALVLKESSGPLPDTDGMSTLEKIKHKRRKWPKKYR